MRIERFLPCLCFSTLLALILAACQGQPAARIETQTIPVTPGQVLVVRVNHGRVALRGSEAKELSLTAHLAQPGRSQIQVSSTPGEITIAAEVSPAPFTTDAEVLVELDLQAPRGISLTVETFDAAISARDFTGQVTIESTAGSILAQGLSGDSLLRSKRGGVRAVNCQGRLRLLGEAGQLEIENAHGEVNASTIMGEIALHGSLQAGDAVHLETDHAQVGIDLGQQTAADIAITSASGEVRCPPGFTAALFSCEGTAGSDAEPRGSLTVRTVSGTVTLRLLP